MFLNYLILFLFFFLPFQSIYLFGGDSAEYSTALSTFSIPHPPGYPLYSLLGNIFTRLIPYLTITWRISLLSSIPTILTAFFIYKILLNHTKNKFIPLFSSVFYLFLYPIWLYGLVPEVFALNNFFIIIITYLIIILNRSQKTKIKLHYLIFFFFGLSISHHHTFILFLPGWYFLLKEKTRKELLKKNLLIKFIFLTLGLSFYLYPPIISLYNPIIDWENAKSISGFLRLISRASYGTFSAYFGSSPNIGNQIFNILGYIIFLIQDFKPIGIFFILSGFFYLFKNINNFSKFLLINSVVLVSFLFYTNFYLRSSFILGIYERYLIFVYLNMIFIFAFGLINTFNLIKKNLNKLQFRYKLKKVFYYSFFIFLILYFLINLRQNFFVLSHIRNLSFFEKYGKEILLSLPKNSILFMKGDTPYFVTQYLHEVEKIRPDIKLIYIPLLTRDYYRERIINKFPDLKITNYAGNDHEFYSYFLKENSKKFDIFFEQPTNFDYWLPYGLVWKYYPSKKKAIEDSIRIINYNENFWSDYKIPKLDADLKKILFLYHLYEIYQNQLLSNIDLLISNKNYDNALFFLNMYKNDIKSNIQLLKKAKIALQKKDCANLKNFYEYLNKKIIYDLTEDEVKIIIKYFGLCDKSNPKVYRYLDFLKKFENKVK